jgi:hypothetical protein
VYLVCADGRSLPRGDTGFYRVFNIIFLFKLAIVV